MVNLMKGDCLELMKEIPDNSIDMVLCDLPFGITRNKWDNVIDWEPLWEAYHRVCKDDSAVVLFGKQPFTTDLINSNRKEFKYCWTWYKHNARGFLNAKKMPMSVTEDVCVFYRKSGKYNPQMVKGELKFKGRKTHGKGSSNYGKYNNLGIWNDIYYPIDILDFPAVFTNEQQHPTQKPVPMLEYLIKTYTNEGETVLDNTMGSGSTGVACVNIGRNFIGMEMEEKYFDIAKKRCEEAERDRETYLFKEGA